MWNRILRQTYCLACLAIFIAIVLVACETPAPGVAAPTASGEMGDISSLAQGETRNVGLSNAFKGEKLTFSVRSDDLGVAIPTIAADNRNIVIRAIGPGTATVTVTATNSGGSASQAFKVTVPPPATTPTTPTTPEEPDPPTVPTVSFLTIKLGQSAEQTLQTGQKLKSPDEAAVYVERSETEEGNVWIITALKKGTYTITIFSSAGVPEPKGIVVKIPNSKPTRNQTYDDDGQSSTANINIPTPITSITTTLDPTRFTAKPGNTTTNFDLGDFFTDPDEDDRGNLRYRIDSKLPSWILLDAENGFVRPDEGPLLFEVLDKQLSEDQKFTVILYAVDDSGGVSDRSLAIEVDAADDADPLVSNYQVRQAPNGKLNRDGTLKVGPRMVAGYHTLTFLKAADAHAGFRFASIKAEALVKIGDLHLAGTDTAEAITASNTEINFKDGASNIPEWIAPNPNANPAVVGSHDVNADYYLLKDSGDVEARWNTTAPTLDGDPKIDFRLTGTGSGTITIEYHVWKYTGSEGVTSSTKGNAADRVTASVSLDIVTCNSPPNPLSDCPGAPD